MKPERRIWTPGSMDRRDFLRTVGATAAAAALFPKLLTGAEAAAGKRSAVDRVTLGRTKVQPSRLAFGTGSQGGSVQRNLGQESFTKLLRHAWDRGIRFFDTADAYKTHGMVGEALKGLPREEYVLLSKMKWEKNPDVAAELDRFRKELGVEYIDVCLIHCASEAGWPAKLEKMRDGLSAAKDKGIIRAVGVSCHGLPALREVAGCDWVDVNFARVNHKGHHMDGPTGKWAEPGDVEAAQAEFKKIHAAGKAIVGMKLIGNGDFKTPEERELSIQAVLKNPEINAVTIGYKTPEEVDEAIARIDKALN